ncbi:hypothetical protein MKW98_015440, partial [Papaver atlanticum]
MLGKLTARFSGRIKTNKRQNSVAEEDYNLISTGQIKEVDVPGFGRFPTLEDDNQHSSTDITFAEIQRLKYHHRGSLASIINHFKFICEHSLRVKYIIERAGWGSLLSIECSETQHSVVDYIVERFWDTTNTFHFPFGEMGFTPLDWVMLTGLSIGDGPAVPYNSGKYQFEYVRQHIFLDIQDASLFPKKALWVSNSITITYLSSYSLKEKLVEAENDNNLAHRVAIAFFMYVLRHFFFSNAKTYIDVGWLAAFEDLDAVSTYDWGSAAFSRLYAALRSASRRQKALSGAFQILE